MAHDHSPKVQNRQRLALVLVLTAAFMLAEFVAGLLTNSLALLADAGHMLTDVGGLALAVVAMRFAERPATPDKTYGYHRVEILAATANAVVLIVISVFILFEAYERWHNPPAVATRAMLLVAVFGLVVNLAGAALLRSGAEQSLNLKGAYFEVLSDLLSSVGVIAAAAVMWRTGWYWADPLVSAAIGLFILPRTWRLLKEAVDILLEGTPAHVDMAELRRAMESVPGVTRVHDLHAWTITSGMHALSAHAGVAAGCDGRSVLGALRECATRFRITHVTIQLEDAACGDPDAHD
jgi:cobalt-zinc-cadmium efflux system protein